jgi:peptide/nickel transport system permease protein
MTSASTPDVSVVDDVVGPATDALQQPRIQRRRRTPFGLPVVVLIAAAWLILVVVLALAADLLPLRDPGQTSSRTYAPLGLDSEPFGTDRLGRSQASRLIYGARASLAVGTIAAGAALVVGGLVGLIAGYFRGAVDSVVSLVVDAVLSLPGLVLLVAFASVFKPTFVTIGIALALIAGPSFARIARGNTMTITSREFVLAARTMGATDRRIMFRELVPNIVPPLLSYAFIIASLLITAEASLSFLGLGIQPPTPSWGVMIANGRVAMEADTAHWHLVFVPAFTLFMTVLSLNLLGDHLRQRVSDRGR